MTSELKPTIGRIIEFRISDGIAFPAIITKVIDKETIELEIFGTQHTKNRYNVKRGDNVGEWQWMKFTRDQAARPGWDKHNDALEKEKFDEENKKAPGDIETETGMDAKGSVETRQVN